MTWRHRVAVLALVGLMGGCDGPHEKAGEQADAAAGIKDGALSKAPGEPDSEIQDRAQRDQKKAIEA